MLVMFNFLFLNYKTIIGFALIFGLILWHFNRRHLYYASWQLDGPLCIPLLGNLLLFRRGRKHVFETTKQLLNEYKAPQRFWIGPFFLIVYITEPDDLQIILNHPNALPKPFIYSIGKEWLGNGLLTAPVSIWKPNRMFLQNSFNIKVLDSYINTYNECADILVKKWESKLNLDSFDIFSDVFMCALDIICGTSVSTKMSCQSDDPYGAAYLKATNSMFEIFEYRDVRPWLYPDFMFKLTKHYTQMMENVNVFQTFSKKVLHERKSYWMEFLNKHPDDLPTALPPIDAMIVSTLTSTDPKLQFSDKQILDEIEIIIAGGADSSGHTISYVFLLLAMHPDVQELVYQEILEVNADRKSTFLTKTDLNRTTYLEQVINESMRIFPAVPLVARELSGPVQLTNGVELAAGTTIGIGIRDTHRNKAVWGDDADDFRPERFSPENSKNRHPYAYIPFSGGLRNCIGLKLARFSIRTILFKVLLHYEVSTKQKLHELHCSMHPLAKLEGGWNIRLTKRAKLE